jgi:outer membrane protein assembly factor BamB
MQNRNRDFYSTTHDGAVFSASDYSYAEIMRDFFGWLGGVFGGAIFGAVAVGVGQFFVGARHRGGRDIVTSVPAAGFIVEYAPAVVGGGNFQGVIMKNAKRTMGVMIGAVLLLGATQVRAQDWPQWRGPNRDNRVTGFSAPATWPKALKQKWKITVGIGESSPVLVGDRIYVFGRGDGNEVTRCLDAGSGKEIWTDKYAAATITGPAGGYPGPRSTPAVADGKVCTLGVHGVVSCFDAATGKIVWRKETGAKPQFYTSTSPIIVDGKCIVFVGALTAFDLASGESKWKWSGASTPYGSPVLMTVDGTRQVVTPASGALAGVSLADGKLLWQVKIGAGGFDYQSNFSTPIVDGQTVYYSAAVKAKTGGSMLALKIDKKGDGFNATELWKNSRAADKYHAPLLKDGMLFGVSASGRNFFCLDAKTGNEHWIDKTQRGQCGSILDVGPVLVSLTSDQQIVAFKASNKEYAEVAKYPVPEAWCVPIIAGNRIFVKDKAGSLTLWTVE